MNRLPPGLQCAETDDDVRCWLSILRRSVEPGRSGGRTVLSRPTNRVIDSVIHRPANRPPEMEHRDSGKRIITVMASTYKMTDVTQP